MTRWPHSSAIDSNLVTEKLKAEFKTRQGVHGVQDAGDKHAVQDANVAAQGEMLEADGETSTLEIQH